MTHTCPACQQAIPDGGVVFDLNTGFVTWEGGEAKLTPSQAEIFAILWETRPRVIHQERILQRLSGLWGGDGMEAKTLVVQVCFMRKRLAEAGAPLVVETHYARGYRVVLK
jgi:DNA-binding winged helix-turn-helix (wHTH) protein